jgi:hypothetical protein
MQPPLAGAFVSALFLAVASIHAQDSPLAEKITNTSPDKKFAVRIKYDPTFTGDEGEKSASVSREATRAIELVAMPSKDVVLNLGGEEGGLEPKAVWSQDSKWFAYAISAGPRITETYVCRRSGDTFVDIKTEEGLSVDPGGDTRNQYVHPMRWVKPGTLVLEQFTIFRGGAGDSTIQFTVRFDENGKFHVISKKKIRSKDE